MHRAETLRAGRVILSAQVSNLCAGEGNATVINRDRRCVFVAGSMVEAVTTAAWLTDKGVACQVMDGMTLGGLDGLTGWVGISARGVEVWVEDPARIPEAQRLVAEHKASVHERAAEAEQRGPTEVLCDECQASSVFPASQFGTTQ